MLTIPASRGGGYGPGWPKSDPKLAHTGTGFVL